MSFTPIERIFEAAQLTESEQEVHRTVTKILDAYERDNKRDLPNGRLPDKSSLTMDLVDAISDMFFSKKMKFSP